jgi:hypothetical protein
MYRDSDSDSDDDIFNKKGWSCRYNTGNQYIAEDLPAKVKSYTLKNILYIASTTDICMHLLKIECYCSTDDDTFVLLF